MGTVMVLFCGLPDPRTSDGGTGDAEKYELRLEDSLLVLIPESRRAMGSCIDKKSEMLADELSACVPPEGWS